jgi:hypothetical protein
MDADRLAKLLGMIGSDHDGEALNAAKLANKMVGEAGMTWTEVLGRTANKMSSDDHSDITDVASVCLEIMRSGLRLTMKQRDFIDNIPMFNSPSEKQLSWLSHLLERARAYASSPAAKPRPKQKPTQRKHRTQRRDKARASEPATPPEQGLTTFGE